MMRPVTNVLKQVDAERAADEVSVDMFNALQGKLEAGGREVL